MVDVCYVLPHTIMMEKKQNNFLLKESNQHLVICLSSIVDCFMIITMSGKVKQKIGKFYTRKRYDYRQHRTDQETHFQLW